VTINNVRRGVAQAASLGYWMGAPFARQGYMTEALTALIPFAHGALQLKRIEAACLPHNAASVRLLEKLKFTREGLARQYLCIAGEWQDHLLFARVSGDPLP
jgi:ribosomal-protein-alanine N-acetyltransferase